MKFQVPDMSCNHCVSSVTKAINGLSANASVVVDLNTKVVEVPDSAGINPDDVIKALDDIGYDAILIQASA